MDSEDFKDIKDMCQMLGLQIEYGKDNQLGVVTFSIDGNKLISFDTYRVCSYRSMINFLMGFSKAKELHDKLNKTRTDNDGQ